MMCFFAEVVSIPLRKCEFMRIPSSVKAWERGGSSLFWDDVGATTWVMGRL